MFYLIGCLNFKDFYTNILFSNRMSLLSWAPLFFFFWLKISETFNKLCTSAIFSHCSTIYDCISPWKFVAKTAIMYISHEPMIWQLSWNVFLDSLRISHAAALRGSQGWGVQNGFTYIFGILLGIAQTYFSFMWSFSEASLHYFYFMVVNFKSEFSNISSRNV